MKRTAIAAIIMAIIASCCMGISAKSPTPRKPGTSRTKNRTTIAKIPSDAIKGDFDGDGKQEYVWIEAKHDYDGLPIGTVRLRSTNSKLNGLKWNDGANHDLINLGKLGSTSRDYLGAIGSGHSTWCSFETWCISGGQWKKAIDTFTVWLGDENERRVIKSNRKGYVTILYNDMGTGEGSYIIRRRDLPLKY